MKGTIKIILPVIISVVVFIILCNRLMHPTIPEGYVLINQTTIDSIKTLANKPAEVITKDSIVYRDTIIYISKPNIIPTIITEKVKEYRDSIYTDSIRVWTKVKYDGNILQFDQWYKPVILYRTTTKTIRIPYPVIVPTDNTTDKIFLSGNVGGNVSKLMIGVGVDYINTDGYIFGGQYERFLGENLIIVKVGKVITLKKDKK